MLMLLHLNCRHRVNVLSPSQYFASLWFLCAKYCSRNCARANGKFWGL